MRDSRSTTLSIPATAPSAGSSWSLERTQSGDYLLGKSSPSRGQVASLVLELGTYPATRGTTDKEKHVPSSALVTPGDDRSPVLIHVPHASRVIPPEVRADLLLTDVELAAEFDEATDTATDEIAAIALRRTHLRPTTVVNTLSRLVIDPERLPDAEEPANAFGRGAVYTRTCTGDPLRPATTRYDPLRPEPYPRATELIDTHFRPYTDALTAAVDDRLDACGRAVIIDLHSYPAAPSGFEDVAAARPALCIGTDALHTPHWLVHALRGAFASLPEIDQIAENTPYAGSYVPLRHYGRDERVTSVMIELRRDVYLTDPRTPDTARVDRLGRALAALIDEITARPPTADV
uniref:Putative N-formylglutamate aminohydrolase n=1 Tax=Rhodococcus erythropolis TaxID=1833 RepID=Q6XMV7_RHOER|nr:putative N-formylglutamate aminohydrolase [Rhodococcus erythropolis]